jgi:hypothetical protein
MIDNYRRRLILIFQENQVKQNRMYLYEYTTHLSALFPSSSLSLSLSLAIQTLSFRCVPQSSTLNLLLVVVFGRWSLDASLRG